MFDEPKKTITLGWDYSAAYVQVDPVIDEYPIPSLCIKEQMLINGKPDGKARFYRVAEEIQYDAAAVKQAMQALADSHKRLIKSAMGSIII